MAIRVKLYKRDGRWFYNVIGRDRTIHQASGWPNKASAKVAAELDARTLLDEELSVEEYDYQPR